MGDLGQFLVMLVMTGGYIGNGLVVSDLGVDMNNWLFGF